MEPKEKAKINFLQIPTRTEYYKRSTVTTDTGTDTQGSN